VEEILKIINTHDPLVIHAERINSGDISTIEEEVSTEVAQSFQDALSDPYPSD
jgi:hypothetical protein